MNTSNNDFNDLVFLGTGTKTFQNNASTTGNFSITAGAVIAPSLLTIAGSYSNSGDFDANTNSNTTYFTGTTQTLSGEMTGTADDFYNLVFNNSGSWTFSNNASTTSFTITSGTVTAPSAGLLSIAGNYANNAGASGFVANSGTVYLNGSIQQILSGTMTGSSAFYDLNILNNSGSGDATNTPRSFSPVPPPPLILLS